jgi:tetraacyldisaccharide 4'-kinase
MKVDTLQHRLQRGLLNAWTHRGLVACLLWPVSLLFGLLVTIRRQAYARGWLQSQATNAVVLVVGNVIVGGAGKTPTVIAICQHLQMSGLRIGVISRGYGRRTTDCREVHPSDSPYDVGDEPLLIRQKAQIPVFVAKTRIEAVHALIQHYPQTQIVVCDDGLQHYAVKRNIEVCVFDGRGVGNGWLLPAGPLREYWPRKPLPPQKEPLLVLHTGEHARFTGYRARRQLGAFALRKDGSTVALSEFAKRTDQNLIAIAGIANPQAFFNMLGAKGIHLTECIALPDHYDFGSKNLNKYMGDCVFCTEKDASKLWQTVPNALAVPMELVVDSDFWIALDHRVTQALNASL